MASDEAASKTVRETVAVFHDAEKRENAVMDLETSGFGRADVGLLASEAAASGVPQAGRLDPVRGWPVRVL